MGMIKSFGVVILAIILIVAYTSLFTVYEGESALLLRLGEIVNNPKTNQPKIFGPGLHTKVPFLNQVSLFNTRLQTLTVQSSRIMTAEQKYVLVDYYVKWRIADLPLYYQRIGVYPDRAENLLEQQVNDALRAAFGKRTITDVVSGERMNIMDLLQKRANESAQTLGIQVVDVRIKSIDLPKEVSDSVYARMSAEREQVATLHRATGKASAEKIEASAEARAAVIIAQANADAAQVRADGLAKAADIYAAAYSQDPQFYSFYRSLEAYQRAFSNKHDVLILSPSSQFFKFFNAAQSQNADKP